MSTMSALIAPALGQRRQDGPARRRAGGSTQTGGGAFNCKHVTDEAAGQ